MKILVIHHSADFDGIACREIARRFLGDRAVYVGWDYGQPAPDVAGYDSIYMLDISIDELMGDPRLIWIDHHRTAIEKWPASIRGYRVDGVAACRLAWQWFTDPLETGMPDYGAYRDRTVIEPLAVRLIGEHDIHDLRDPRESLLQHGLRSQPIRWAALLSHGAEDYVAQLVEAGGYVAYASAEGRRWMMEKSSFTLEWEGLRWLAVNGGPSLSSAAYESAVRPEHDACLSFGYVPKIGWKVSMRGVPHKPDLDLSAVAKRFPGGGGHKQACGFSCAVLPWMERPAPNETVAQVLQRQTSEILALRAEIDRLQRVIVADHDAAHLPTNLPTSR